VPEPTVFEFDMANEMLKRDKSPGIDHIPAELIKASDRTIHPEIHKFISFICNKGELPEDWKVSITLPIYKRTIKENVVIIE
jgi:hypothetical protein